MNRLKGIIRSSREVSKNAVAAGTMSIAITIMLPTLSNTATIVDAVTPINT